MLSIAAWLMAGAFVLTVTSPVVARANILIDDSQITKAISPAPPEATSTDLPAICTDRPTKSNAACAVEAGHFQYESDLFNGTFTHANGVTTDTYLVTNPTFKYGVASGLDVEINIAPYEVVRNSSNFGNSFSETGIGDLYFRLKYNFYNSGDGKISVAIIPYGKAPTARLGIGNGAVEGGAIMPISYKVTDKITLTTVPETDAFKDSTGDGRHVNTAQLINIAYSLPKDVTIYGELWGDWNFDPAGTIRQYSADIAAAWSFTKYLQFDVGLNFGLNHATPSVQSYLGVSQKF